MLMWLNFLCPSANTRQITSKCCQDNLQISPLGSSYLKLIKTPVLIALLCQMEEEDTEKCSEGESVL